MRVDFKRQRLAILGALTLASLAAAPTQATIYQLTFSGDTENINDVTGVFGAPGGRITDLAFVQTYTIDTNKGVFVDNSAAGNTLQFLHGGPEQFFPSSAPITATLTIGGTTITYYGGSSSIELENDGGSGPFAQPSFDLNTNVEDQQGTGGTAGYDNLIGTDLYTHNGSPPITSLFQPFSATIDGINLSAISSFTQYSYDAQGNQTRYSLGTLNPTQVTFEPLAADVPEPSSWALMIGGLLMTGAMLRRQRQRIFAPRPSQRPEKSPILFTAEGRAKGSTTRRSASI